MLLCAAKAQPQVLEIGTTRTMEEDEVVKMKVRGVGIPGQVTSFYIFFSLQFWH